MTSTAPLPPSRTRVALTITAVIVAALVVVFFIFSGLYTDILWFDQLGFLPVLTTQWFATAVMFATHVPTLPGLTDAERAVLGEWLARSIAVQQRA